MARKAKKVGKNRQDKYYQLAKEQGFRSRASFKLVQLNRRFDFLSAAAHGVLDLCAAPGGWLQVARKYMPVAAPCVGVDLVPIRSIPGCHTIAADITTDACRAAIRRHLKEAHPAHNGQLDLVLNDGSPNMGTAWLQDAYTQAELTLHALRLATDFLRPGGWFVSKVFRSTDYNSLLFVFGQLFTKVVATKPVASRNESAEIYVACSGYLAPKTIDPRLLDPKHVFQDLAAGSVTDAEKSTIEMQAARKLLLGAKASAKQKSRAVGYPEGNLSLFTSVPIRDFVSSDHPLTLLARASELRFEKPGDQLLLEMPQTTEEVLRSCADLQVLGRKEFKQLLKWRSAARRVLKGENNREANNTLGASDDQLESASNLSADSDEDQLQEMQEKLLAKTKREKKKAARLRNKAQRKIDLKMILPEDEFDLPVEEGLFSLKTHRTAANALIHNGNRHVENDDDASSEEEREMPARHQRKSTRIVSRDGDDYRDEIELQLEHLYGQYLSRRKAAQKPQEDAGELNNKLEENAPSFPDDPGSVADSEEGDSGHSDVAKGEESDLKEPQGKAKLWFSNPIFREALMRTTEGKDSPRPQVKRAADGEVKTERNESDSRREALDVDTQAELMAIAKAVKLKGRHHREKMLDDTCHRYAFDDVDLQLPEWFRAEDSKARERHKPVSKAEIEEAKAALQELKSLPSRKEAEARGRKKMKAAKRFEAIKQRANSIADQADVSSESKMKAIEKLYQTSGLSGGKPRKSRTQTKQYVVAVAGGGRKNVGKSTKTGRRGKSGRIKYVDKRLKSDKRGIQKKTGSGKR